jgi:tRNA1Val (adenine37-N6)-methyltransferase
VGTDGVLIGGYTASLTSTEEESWPHRILDVGCGSGVITMMLAQKFQTTLIDAVDIDTDAIRQTTINVEQQPQWKSRITIHHTPIQQYSLQNASQIQYDLIVCAPPYFVTALNKEAEDLMENKRIVARHLIGDKSYNLSDLFQSIVPLLKPVTGRFCFIFPSRDDIWDCISENGLEVVEVIHVRDNPQTQVIRNMYQCRVRTPDSDNHSMIEKDFSIYTELVPKKTTVQVKRKYTQEYTELLHEFCNHM